MSPLASAAPSTGSGLGSLLLLALPLVLIVYLVVSQRRRQRQLASAQAGLQVGDEVMTTTGLYGRVVSLQERVVELEAAPGVVLRWDRRAVVPAPQHPEAGTGTGTDGPE